MNTAPWLAAPRRFGIAALDLVLPPCCASCQAPTPAWNQLCAPCFLRIRFIAAPFCSRCGGALTAEPEAAAGLCPNCASQPPAFRQARAALVYDDHSKRLILALKHGDRAEIAALLAPFMARAGAALLEDADWLVPVPLHLGRLRHRRYNQAGVLAVALGRLSGVATLRDGLVRLRATEALGHLHAAARNAMLAGAIGVRPSRAAQVAGTKVVLVDDVMTSGATANACSRALLAAGVARVDVVVAARVEIR